MKRLGTILIFFLLFSFTACTKKDSGKPTIWIYTSLYKETIAMMGKILEKKFPEVEFKWYQSGSENVAARINAELSAGGTLADLIMTSDPFWYVELKAAGHLLKYRSPKAAELANRFKDGDGAFTIVRIPVVVMAYNSKAIPKGEVPSAFSDLLKPKWKGKVSMGSPLQSGTSFCAVAQLVRKHGWRYFEQLRKNDVLSAGGNSAVISRMETQERPVGIVLLENVLDAQRRGSPVVPIYPTDGIILAPSPIAILAKTEHPELAKKIYDYFFENELQIASIKNRMYSPFPHIPAPDGARAFKLVLNSSMEWSPTVLADIHKEREGIKKRFLEIVLN